MWIKSFVPVIPALISLCHQGSMVWMMRSAPGRGQSVRGGVWARSRQARNWGAGGQWGLCSAHLGLQGAHGTPHPLPLFLHFGGLLPWRVLVLLHQGSLPPDPAGEDGGVQKHSGLVGGFTGLFPGQSRCSAQNIFESTPQMAVVQIFIHGVCVGDHSDMYEKIKANFSLFYITTID